MENSSLQVRVQHDEMWGEMGLLSVMTVVVDTQLQAFEKMQGLDIARSNFLSLFIKRYIHMVQRTF